MIEHDDKATPAPDAVAEDRPECVARIQSAWSAVMREFGVIFFSTPDRYAVIEEMEAAANALPQALAVKSL